MSILFFEGLPRAGKSYEAMVTQIIPFLKRGKHVVAYIEGLDFARIAQAAELDEDTVREYLHPLTREDMKPREVKGADGKKVKVDGSWIDKIMDNALHVFDEAQNWWGYRNRPTDELTQFVSEHGHRGMTILLMGQSLKDVQALWRRRVDQKLVFLKLTALGADKRYQVTVFKGQGDETFAKVTTKINKYDPKYFGTYASHVSEDTDTETYTDGRVNVFKSSLFTWVLPCVLVLGGWGAWTAWKFFNPVPVKPKPGSVSAAGAIPPAAPSLPVAQVGSEVASLKVAAAPSKSAEERYFVDLTGKGRARLGGFLQTAQRHFVVIEWLDSGTRVIERMSLEQLEALGVTVTLRSSTVRLSLGEWSQIVTMWPIDVEGRVSEYGLEKARAMGGGQEPAAQQSALSPGLTLIDGTKAAVAPAVAADASPSKPRVQPVSKWSFQAGG